MDKCKNNVDKALFYVRKTLENNWSRSVLLNFLDTDLCNFDFLTLHERYHEKELKDALIVYKYRKSNSRYKKEYYRYLAQADHNWHTGECPTLGSLSVESALKKLVHDGFLTRLGAGRKTHYVRSYALE